MITVPVENPPDPSFSLRLMSGPQAGAEMPLAEGDYLIGKDDDNDLVLLDDSVAGQHMRVSIRSGEAQVEVLDRMVAVGDHSLQPGEKADVGAGAVFGLGSTCVAIAPLGVDWASLKMPDRRRGGRRGEAGAGAAPGSSSASAAQPSGTDWSGDPAAAGAVAAAASDATVAATPASDGDSMPAALMNKLAANASPSGGAKGHRSVPAMVWAVAGFALALALFALQTWIAEPGGATDTSQSTVVAASGKSRVEALLKQMGFNAVKVETTAVGRLRLKGYVPTTGDKDRLTAALNSRFNNQGVRVQNEVWAENWLEQTAGETLRRVGGGDLKYKYLGKGVVRVRGFLDSSMSSEQLAAVVRNDVPGITKLDLKLRTMDQAMAELRGNLAQAGLQDFVALAADGSEIVATGTLEQALLQAWWKIAHAFAKEYLGVPRIRSDVKARRDGTEPFTLARVRVIGVVMGPEHKPMAMLDNGNLVGVGDSIGADAVVEKIEFDRIEVRDGDRTYNYNVEGG